MEEFTWRNWSAWREQDDDGSTTLRVHGECVFPLAGHNVELQSMQGDDPPDLLLNLFVRPPAERAAEVETVVPADYVLKEAGAYRSVTIKSQEGKTIQLTIEDKAPEALHRAA